MFPAPTCVQTFDMHAHCTCLVGNTGDDTDGDDGSDRELILCDKKGKGTNTDTVKHHFQNEGFRRLEGL